MDYKDFILKFVNALCSRDYAGAYEMTNQQYRRTISLSDMKSQFEMFVPVDGDYAGWTVLVSSSLDDWPTKEDSDIGWAYVSIGGECHSEGVAAVIALEDGKPKIRAVEFGRP